MTLPIPCYNLRIMTLIELRHKLHNICMDAGGVKPWADKQGIAFSYVAAVIRGDTKPGAKVLKAMGLRKAFQAKKTTVLKFEDITN